MDLAKPHFRLDRASGALVPAPRIGATAADPFTSRIGPAHGGFEATRGHRRLSRWNPSSANLNARLSAGGDMLRRRALDAAWNNPYVTSALASFKAHAVGTGIKPIFLARDAGKKAELQRLWSDWVDEADADGVTSFYGQQAIMAGSLFSTGESFARLRYRRAGDGLAVPLQVQLLPSIMLPLELNRIEANGNETRCGIEFDALGRRAAYHFHRNHPGDFTRQTVAGEPYVRVPAEEVCHLFLPEEEGGIRGKSWITASLVRLYLLDLFDDAAVQKMLITNLFGVAITKPPGEQGPLPADADGDGEGGLDGDPAEERNLSLSSGMTLELETGEDIKVIDPGEVGDSYEPFQYRSLTAASAGMGVPYSNVTFDKMKANYSNERSAKVEVTRRTEQLQAMTLIFQLCRPVARAFQDQAVLARAISLPGYAERPRSWQRVKWVPQPEDYVDPVKDRQAEQIAVQERWKARSDVIAQEGDDGEAVDARIALDQEREDRLEIIVPRPEPAPAPAEAPEPADDGAEADPPAEKAPAPARKPRKRKAA